MFKVAGFVPNPDMIRAVESSPSLEDGITKAAADVVNHAKTDAPRGRRHPGWHGSFRAVPATDVDGKMTAYAVSDHPVATIIEFGSVKNPPYRTLTRAAQSVGTFKDAK